MTDIRAVEFLAEVRQVKTMADGSCNVTINVPEHMRDAAKKIMDWHHEIIRVLMEVQDERPDTGKGRKIHI